jgi:hypothetical protein
VDELVDAPAVYRTLDAAAYAAFNANANELANDERTPDALEVPELGK